MSQFIKDKRPIWIAIFAISTILGASYTAMQLSNAVSSSQVATLSQFSTVTGGCSIIVFTDGTKYYDYSGDTRAQVSSGTDAATVIQNAINTLPTSAGGSICIREGNYPLNTPITIPTSSSGPITISGIWSETRTKGTTLSVGSSLANNTYLIKTNATAGTGKGIAVVIQNLFLSNTHDPIFGGGNNLKEGGIWLESDNAGEGNTGIIVKNIDSQYMVTSLRLTGMIEYGIFDNLNFYDSNAAFVGNSTILLEQGSHTDRPKVNVFNGVQINQFGTYSEALLITDGSYNRFYSFDVDGTKYTDAPIAFKNTKTEVASNLIDGMRLQDLSGGTPLGAVLFDSNTGTIGTHDNIISHAYLPKYNTFALTYKNNAYQNYVSFSPFDVQTAFNVTKAGAYNTIEILPNYSSGKTYTAPTNGNPKNVTIWDVNQKPEVSFFDYQSTGTNFFHYAPYAGVLSNNAVPKDTLYAYPLVVPKTMTISQLGYYVQTGSAGALAVAGIYNDTGSIYPGTLLVDTTALNNTSTGLKTAAVTSTQLTPGLYWLSYTCGTGAATIQGYTPESSSFVLGFLTSNPTSPNYGYKVARVYDGTMPTTFPGGALKGTTTAEVAGVGYSIASYP